MERGTEVMVWVSPAQSPSDAHGTCIHEAVHVFQKLRKYIGEDSPGDEWEAYTIEYIATSLIKEYEAHALHDQRKARLQEGSGEVHVKAGSNQEEN